MKQNIAEIICRDKDLEFENNKLNEKIQKLKQEIVNLKFTIKLKG
jgi:predicted nuclease with TOPRIM domain